MKKLYSTLALACAVSLSVSGAEKLNLQATANGEVSAKTLMYKDASSKSLKAVKGKERKKANKVDDLYGKYKMNYEGMLSSNKGPQVSCVTISASEKGGTAVEVSGMPFNDVAYQASVDLENGTLTIPKQIAYYNTYYNENVMFVTESASSNTEKYPAPADGELVLNINEDGTLSAVNWWDAPCLRVEAGYFWAGADLYLSLLELYSFDPSVWKEVGTCSYTDGFMLPAFLKPGETQASFPSYNCKVLQNMEEEGEYAVVNPYGEESIFAEANEFSDRPGYIIFNIANPDCVPVRPLVGSGMWMDDSEEEGQEPVYVETYCFNVEGNKYYNMDVSTEDQVEEVIIVMEDDEELSDYLSSYDAETKTVTILGINSYFSMTAAPLSLYYWTKQDPEKPNDETARVRNMFDTKIVFDFDPSGVNDILVDNSNAPVKYYNLQGMEVANPEAGQLVIMKQGSKVSKFIKK